MTSYIVKLDCYEDKELTKLALHHEWSYGSQGIAECAMVSMRFDLQAQPILLLRWGHDSFPEQYVPYVNIYITTEEYQTLEEEANADDTHH